LEQSPSRRIHGDHAVVIGAGLAGLLAARVLAARFRAVTVVERDDQGAELEARKGAPQGSHIHLLLVRGAEILEQLFPGISDELVTGGGIVGDSTRDLAFYNFGSWQPRGTSHLPARLQSRPFLEWHVAQQVESVPNVRFLRRRTATGPIADPSGRIRGLRLRSCDDGTEDDVEADLVVDAAGRGSRTPQWLRDLGFPAPETTEVGLSITYASRFFRVADGPHDWAAMLVYPRVPREVRGGALYLQERDRWIATIASYAGESPPRTDEEFLAFAKGLPSLEIYRQIRDAEPLSGIRTFHYPGAMRRHYERLPRLPEGLIVIGDAVCSFNPVFGQGMTSAALQARGLATCLDQRGLSGLPQRFARHTARLCRAPWFLSTTMDLRYPHAIGRRSPVQPLLNWYLDLFFDAAAHDFALLRDFMRVLHLVAPPALLARPTAIAKVLASALRRQSAHREARPPLEAYSEAGTVLPRRLPSPSSAVDGR
jgi:2-polyprenyl-6-methoxyphenol hydroxylase-like FAD-dependent oxidoreductase